MSGPFGWTLFSKSRSPCQRDPSVRNLALAPRVARSTSSELPAVCEKFLTLKYPLPLKLWLLSSKLLHLSSKLYRFNPDGNRLPKHFVKLFQDFENGYHYGCRIWKSIRETWTLFYSFWYASSINKTYFLTLIFFSFWNAGLKSHLRLSESWQLREMRFKEHICPVWNFLPQKLYVIVVRPTAYSFCSIAAKLLCLAMKPEEG